MPFFGSLSSRRGMINRRGNKSRVSRLSGQLGMEALEPRVVLASDLAITEFQASNGATLFDEDGDTPDWIEIQNQSLETVNLDGWYLTDDPRDLTKWQFPSVDLEADQFMVILASGKDRTESGSELHTNFSLNSSGEYLALVEPDGVTLATEFSPEYPNQITDQSYGLAIGRDTEVFVDGASTASAFVPTDGSLGTSWTEVGFDDSSWATGTQGIGYEQALPGFTVRDDFDGPLGPEWTVEIPGGGSTFEVSGGTLNVTVPSGTDTGEVRGTAPFFLQDTPTQNSDYEITTRVSLSEGSGLAGIVVKDGITGLPSMAVMFNRVSGFISQIQMVSNENAIKSNVQFNTSSIYLRLQRSIFDDSWTGSWRKNENDDWTVLATATEGSGVVPQISSPQIGLGAKSPGTRQLPVEFDFFEVEVGEELPVYDPLTGLDVEGDLAGKATSVYVRIPFMLENADRFDEMDLGISYDDGYIAYLNGVEVGSRNVPIVSSWDSAASGVFGAVDGQVPVAVDSLNGFTDNLRNGENVLAIHGMNVAADDNDFFLNMSLSASEILSTSAQSFVTPTPGADNVLPAAPLPTFSHPGGTFIGSRNIELSLPVASPNLQIRYTIDGTEPTESSTLYTNPISLTKSAWLRARTFDTSLNPAFSTSNAVSESYIALHSSLRDRDSDLPILVIDTLGQGFPDTGSTTQASGAVALFDVDSETGRAKVLDGNLDYSGSGGFRKRGSSTGGNAKPNLAFETWGSSGSDENFSLLGMPAESDWVLYGPFSFDRTFIHEPFIYSLSNDIGLYASRAKPVEVYANTSGGTVGDSSAHYHGIYILIEKIKQGSDRVDVPNSTVTATYDPTKDIFDQDRDITGGYVFKIDRADPGEPQISAGGYSLSYVYPKSPADSSNGVKATPDQEAYARAFLDEFWSVLNNPNKAIANDPVNGWSKYIEMDSWIDYHLLNIITMNVDAQRLSTYFSMDDGKISFGPIWDFDRTLESTDSRDDDPNVWRSEVGDLGTDFFGEAGDGSGGRWWRQLFQDPNFFQAYIDRYHELRQGEFSDRALDDRINRWAADIEESVPRNLSRWGASSPRSGGCFEGCNGTWQGEVENMRNWLHARIDFMDRTFPFTPTVSLDGANLPVTPQGIMVESGAQLTASSPDGPPQSVVTDSLLVSGVPGAVAVKYFVPTDNDLETDWTSPTFNDNAWSDGTNGIGFDYAGLVTTDVNPRDVNANATTVMTRTEFTANPANLDDLILQVMYDDAFVAYLNGTEVARSNVTGTVNWNTTGSDHPDGSATTFEDFNINQFKNLLVDGTNVLAVQVVQASATSSDMLINPQLVSREVTVLPPGAAGGKVYYTLDGTDPRGIDGMPSSSAVELLPDASITITENTQVIMRNLDGTSHGPESNIITTDWSAPIKHNFVVTSTDLVISELNYNPVGPTLVEEAALLDVSDEDFEFIEVMNPGTTPVNLAGIALTNGVQFDFTASSVDSLAPGERILVVSNETAFNRRYGAGLPVVGEFEGSLSNTGERVTLSDGLGADLFSVAYSDASYWPVAADGAGSTLELVDPNGADMLTNDKYYSWQASREIGGTPGSESSGPVGVVINEVLVNTEESPAFTDSIELHNTTGSSVDIGGWFLSDGSGNFQKFEIPAGTSIAAGGYVVFDESDFNTGDEGFALSGTDGDDVWLTSPDAGGDVAFIVDDVHFGGAPVLESFGRVPNGSGRLAPMLTSTLGATNSDPRVGPVIISEINYNPGVPSDGALAIYSSINSGDLEFIEIHNPTSELVDLSDWRLRGGADLTFDVGTSIGAGGTAVVISFNPDRPNNAKRVAAFREHYGISDTVRLIGGYGGQLSNGGDRVELQRATTPFPSRPLVLAYVSEDEVLFDDLAPWATSADGTGATLQRVSVTDYGNDAASWIGAASTIGFVGDGPNGDVNGDGATDADDIDAVYDAVNAGSNDLTFDLNADGAVTAADATFLVESILVVNEGDANLDGVVDAMDLNAVGLNWQSSDNVGWASGDFDGDGSVTAADLNKVGVNWLKGAAAPVRAPRAALAAIAAPEAVDRAFDHLDTGRLEIGSGELEASTEDALMRRSRPLRRLSDRRSIATSDGGGDPQPIDLETDREMDFLDRVFALRF